MADWSGEVGDFVSGFGAGQEIVQRYQRHKMAQEQHAEQLRRARQVYSQEEQKFPVEMDTARQTLEHQRFLHEKAMQLFPIEMENAMLEADSRKADINYKGLLAKGQSMNIAEKQIELDLLKRSVVGKQASIDLENQQSRDALELYPEVYRRSKYKATTQEIQDQTDRRKEIGESHAFTKRLNDSEYAQWFATQPFANDPLFRQQDGSLKPIPELRRMQDIMYRASVEDIETQRKAANESTGQKLKVAQEIVDTNRIMRNTMPGTPEYEDAKLRLSAIQGQFDDFQKNLWVNELVGQARTGNVDPDSLDRFMALKAMFGDDPAVRQLEIALRQNPKYREQLTNMTSVLTSAPGKLTASKLSMIGIQSISHEGTTYAAFESEADARRMASRVPTEVPIVYRCGDSYCSYERQF